MERRTILTALATAPLAALASTAHALGRRRRQCYDQPSDSVEVSKGEVPKDVDTPHLTLTPIPGMPGVYTVVIKVDVTPTFIAGVIEETIMMVEARLVNAIGAAVPGFNYQAMAVDPIPAPAPPAVHYILSKSPVMLTPTATYRAQVRVTFTKREFGLSAPQTA